MGSTCLMTTEFQFGEMENILEMDSSDSFTTM